MKKFFSNLTEDQKKKVRGGVGIIISVVIDHFLDTFFK